jgi:tRNA U34 2-thiouridine synthase MnmA/TrmU
MLKEAMDYMSMTGCDFVITGEVAGQRPMSQRRFALDLITRECGLDGRLVRPLSGKLLPATLPEKQGLIKREWLLDIEGRSRKRQMALAEEFGLTEYPNPAGGCLLTDEGYSKKLRDMLKKNPDIDFNDLNLLRAGRYFRLNPQSLLVVGRNEAENDTLESLYRDGDIRLEAPDFKSPIGLLRGHVDNNILELAASIVARYSDGKNEKNIKIVFKNSAGSGQLETSPASQSLLETVRI